MNKSAIKTFAVRARNKLIEDIIQKAYELGITKEEIKDIETFEGGFKIKGLENSKNYKKYEIKQREKLVSNIKEKGFDQVIEEVAYTWFNRFIALRFMEVNEYLPTGVRVLSSLEEGKTEPDIIKEALNIDFDLDTREYEEYKKIVYRLIDTNDTEDLYRYLIVKQCNQLGSIMPMVFEEISDYTELLLPNNLLAEGSVIRDLVESIEEDDYREQVEIIGWLYQYYISEKKDEVFADLKKNKKITKENIPAATQLFTPKWIVKYMVENSLGRLWLESYPDEELQSQWKYYLEEAEQDPEVQKKLDELKDPNLNPEDIKVLDPSMGSGHILVYAFDVLYDIYLKANYSERDIPQLILGKNLYGLDIDDRAGQLAAFALMMKARSKNRRIFRKVGANSVRLNLNVCSIQESNGILKEALEYFCRGDQGSPELHHENNNCRGDLRSPESGEQFQKDIEYLTETFHDAKEYGSILDVEKVDFDAIERRLEEIRNGETVDLYELQYREIILEKLPSLIKQGKIMSEKYDVVCTNPPYMGNNGMNIKLKALLSKNFQDSKTDLFAVFMEIAHKFLIPNGIYSMINQHSWMFISSYSDLRKKILYSEITINMLHLGARAFEEIAGEVVQSTVFIQRKQINSLYKGRYIRLTDLNTSKEKEIHALSVIKGRIKGIYESNANDFKEIPNYTIAYWISKKLIAIFKRERTIKDCYECKSGIMTGNDNVFVKLWYEMNNKDIKYNAKSYNEMCNYSWFPLNKGGGFRRYYGNNEYIVYLENMGQRIKQLSKNYRLRDKDYYFLEGITWSRISTGDISFREAVKGSLFADAGPMIFISSYEDRHYILALLNSKIVVSILKMLNPTMNYQVNDIENIPILYDESTKEKIISLVEVNKELCKKEWDSYETSWDFKYHALLMYSALKNDIGSNKIEKVFNQWLDFTNEQFVQLKANEEELNRIFIDIYGLQEELTPEVEDKDITIRKADRQRDIKSFISYAVGCMFGRYSLDEEGLIYAGGEFKDKFRIENGEWRVNTKEGWKKSSIAVDMDNVIVIADDDYFEDDIVNRFVEFVKITFGEETLEENLDYIAETLGQKASETARQTIGRYFLKDFYKDHVKTYSKRPIYWLFDSGKQNGFKALIYMHRYDTSTVARVRTDYLHKLQKMYEAEVKRLDILLESDLSAREKAAAMKKKESIHKQIQECMTYDQVIAHIANQKIEIDLDEGVKYNYELFQGIEVPQGEGKKPLKANLLAKI